MAEHFCGCCGNQLRTNAQWCGSCRRHVLNGAAAAGLAPWERTYFAQHDEDCPVPLKDFMNWTEVRDG